MKKYVFLTSVLALAACGGGSGGHGGADYVAPRAAVTPQVAESNSGVTGMNSEIVVASNSLSPVAVREASTTKNNVTYVSYRLDDVNLYIAEKLGDDDAWLNFNVDPKTGEINAVKMVMGGKESGYITREMKDNHYANSFNGPIFEYVPDGDDRATFRVVDTGQTMEQLQALEAKEKLSGGHWNRVDEMMDFVSYGKNVGLQYADFGYFNPVYKSKNKELNAEVLAAVRSGRDAVLALGRGDKDKMRTDEDFQKELAKEDYQLFAGGYAISGTKMEKTLNPENDTSYKGTAIGRVYVSVHGLEDGIEDKSEGLSHFGVAYDNEGKNGYTDNAGHDISKLYTTNDATLKIDANGNRVLLMQFNTKAADNSDKFYDIEISHNADKITGIKFTGNEALIGNQYREQGAFGLDAQGNVDFDKVKDSNFASGFYGVNTPVEAAGAAQMTANDVVWKDSQNHNFQREYEVQAAWGLKKQ